MASTSPKSSRTRGQISHVGRGAGFFFHRTYVVEHLHVLGALEHDLEAPVELPVRGVRERAQACAHDPSGHASIDDEGVVQSKLFIYFMSTMDDDGHHYK